VPPPETFPGENDGALYVAALPPFEDGGT